MLSIKDLLLELVKIDSLTGQEKELSEWISKRYQQCADVIHSKSGYTKCYHFQIDPELPRIGIYGHLDTVTNQQAFAPVEKDGLLYGCGSSDMKGGLAVMIRLMDKLLKQKDKARFNLYFVFYDREEGPAEENGLFRFVPENIRELSCDLALVMEPTDNTIQKGCVGSLHADIIINGKSGHSARPWEGENAIHKAWRLLKTLDETTPRKATIGGLDFYEVYTATIANGGQTRNSVPAEFTVDVNYRFAPNKTDEQAADDVKTMFSKYGQISIRDIAPSGKVVSENTILDDLIGQYSLKTLPKQAWTDIARLNLHHIPAVNFGPGTPSMAHQKNEYIRADSLQQSEEMLSRFIFKP